MKKYNNPNRQKWEKLTQRPTQNQEKLNSLVKEVFEKIRKSGDKAVRKYSLIFDNVNNDSFTISKRLINSAANRVEIDLQKAILLAKSNIEKFHWAQREKTNVIETSKGVKCWRESRAINSVGIYIPGGSAPLFSTVLMLGIPAKLAGCKEIVLCSPPNNKGEINPVILYAAKLVGIEKIYAIGGIQAIAAMTFGTQTIPKVDKIFGPGNQFVTAAKQLSQNYGVAIDMPAGPSEVLIIADKFSNPSFVAADLLSQAEHGPDSQVILLSNQKKTVDDTMNEIEKQIKALPRKTVAKKALKNSKAIVLQSLSECVEFSNMYAPEHLILATRNFSDLIKKIANAGSVFLGEYSCESAGDYASGTNHTLPTNGYARNYSGVSLDSFVKKITFQELTSEGIKTIGPSIEKMALAEQLFAHKNAVSVRLKTIK